MTFGFQPSAWVDNVLPAVLHKSANIERVVGLDMVIAYCVVSALDHLVGFARLAKAESIVGN